MKKLLALILIAVSILSLFSCTDGDEDGMVKYSQYGLSYRLPEEFKAKKTQNADISYSDGEAWFYLNAFGNDEMLELGLPSTDITVEEYTEFFLILNPYNTEDYEYDRERNASTFYYIYDYATDKMENEYYGYLITRNEETLFVVLLSCKEKDFGKYSADFEKIFGSVALSS